MLLAHLRATRLHSRPRRSWVRQRSRDYRRLVELEPLEQRRLLTAVPTWVAQGPQPLLQGQPIGMDAQGNPQVGMGETVAVDPNQPSTLYIGASNGGMWKSTDATASNLTPTWTPLGTGLPSLAIGDIAVSPLNSNVIYAGTGNFTNGSFGEFGTENGGVAVGVYKSTDAGTSWQILGASTFTGASIRRILPTSITTTTGQLVLAAVPKVANPPAGEPGIGLYMSKDGGTTWTLLSNAGNGLPDGQVNDVEADPTDPNRFFAGVFGGRTAASNGIYQGVYDSASGTITWTQINGTGSNVIPAGLLPDLTNLKLSVVNQGGTPWIYVLTGQEGTSTGGAQPPGISHVYVSNDLGTNWNNIDIPPSVAPDGINVDGNEQNDLAIAADPGAPDHVFVSGSSAPTPGFGSRSVVFDAVVSVNAGTWSATWTSAVGAGASNTIAHSDTHDLVFDHDGNLVMADDGGFYRLLNPTAAASSRSWVALTGNLETTELYSVAYNSIDHVIFGGAQDNSSGTQVAQGSTRWITGQGGDATHVAVDNSGSQAQLYVIGPGFDQFFRETYAGSNKPTYVTIPLASNQGGGPLSGLDSSDQEATDGAYIPFVLNAVNPQMLAIGYNGLYESTNQGNTVTDITPSAKSGGYFSALAYGGYAGGAANPYVLYAAVSEQGKAAGPSQLFLRTSQGGSFSSIGTFASAIRSIVLDPNDWHTAYLVLSDRILQVQGAGTSNVTISDITGNLGTLAEKFQSVTIYNPSTTPGAEVVLIGALPRPGAGASSGVFVATNPYLGASTAWTSVGIGLPNVQVHDLVYNPQDNILVAGTFGRGAWAISQAGAYLPTTSRQTTTTTLTTSPNPSLLGAPVTLTAAVSDPPSGAGEQAAATPTGTVTFLDGTTVLGTAPLVGGVATLSLSSLPAGTLALRAVYSGDPTDLTSASTVVNQVVSPTVTTLTTVTATTNPALVGSPITFVALVFAASPPTGTPTGTVTFLDGTTVLGTAPVSGGTAIFTTTSLGPGNHTITAAYVGNSPFLASTSAPLTQVVTPIPPVVTSVTRSGIHNQPTTLVVTFNEPMDTTRAQTLTNYQLVMLRYIRGRHPSYKVVRVIRLRLAVSNSSHQTVTLSPVGRLNIHQLYELTVRGTSPLGLTSTYGQYLDGKNNGQPGSNYATLILGYGAVPGGPLAS